MQYCDVTSYHHLIQVVALAMEQKSLIYVPDSVYKRVHGFGYKTRVGVKINEAVLPSEQLDVYGGGGGGG